MVYFSKRWLISWDNGSFTWCNQEVPRWRNDKFILQSQDLTSRLKIWRHLKHFQNLLDYLQAISCSLGTQIIVGYLVHTNHLAKINNQVGDFPAFANLGVCRLLTQVIAVKYTIHHGYFIYTLYRQDQSEFFIFFKSGVGRHSPGQHWVCWRSLRRLDRGSVYKRKPPNSKSFSFTWFFFFEAKEKKARLYLSRFRFYWSVVKIVNIQYTK